MNRVVALVVAVAVSATCQTVSISVSDTVIRKDVERFGIVLGAPNSYGAENFMRNMVPNPGFEPGLYGMVVTILKASGNKVQSDYWSTEWHTPTIGQPEDFWNGGTWEIPSQNVSGTITDFTHENNRYTWVLDRPVDVAPQEVMYVRMEVQNRDTPQCPNSDGVQSLELKSPGNTWQTVNNMYFDVYSKQGDTSAGTLRVVRGAHRIAFWAKGPGVIAPVINRGAKILFEKKFQLTNEWAPYEATFDGEDSYQSGSAPPLQLGWKVVVGDGAYIDDLFVGPVGEGAFADELVEAVKRLRPGVIRAWQLQHGETLANQLAGPFARKTHDFSPKRNRANNFSYSLPEFLDLCRAAGAAPWYVVPPTFTLDEMRDLREYLAKNTADFHRVYIEFANEAWGSNNPHDDPFAGASFNGGARLAQCAERAFNAFGELENVTKIIGGQAAWPGQNELIANNSKAHDQIVIAPYFGVLKEAWERPEHMFYPLYGRAYVDVRGGKIQQSEKWVSGVYEVNFHTTGGAKGNKDAVNDFVTSQAGGIALPLYMLLYQREFGWSPQTVFTLAQYSAGDIRIWGVYRDIMATGRIRPTGLALELANQAIQGDMITAQVSMSPNIPVAAINGIEKPTEIPAVDAFAWKDGNRYSLYVTNLSMDRTLTLELNATPTEVLVLTHPDPMADNEEGEQVRIETLEDWDGKILPHAAYVMKW